MKKSMFTLGLGLTAAAGYAVNPVVWTRYTADPAPIVVGDTFCLYTSHDDDASKGFQMFDWLLYKTTDMVNFTDVGSVASLDDMKWYKGKNGAWAPQVVARNGKFYMYVPVHGHGISVLVADTPEGPFVDVLGKQLVWQRGHWDDIDPTVFIDDDGQAYLYWGNPNLYMVKLNEDMISCAGEIVKYPKIQDYQEGPWLFKREGKYYLAFSSTCCPEGIGYAMSDKPTGPWEYKGDIFPHDGRSSGNHPGIVEYKGKWYVAGFNYEAHHQKCDDLGIKYFHAERRSVSIEELEFNADGTIKKIDWWNAKGLAQLHYLDPFVRVEAETMAKAKWVKTRRDVEKGMVLTEVHDGDFVMLQGVDMGEGAKAIRYTARPLAGGTVEVRLDKADGPMVGSFEVTGKSDWREFSAELKDAKGVHDLYFVFRGETGLSLLEADCWQMTCTGR